MPTLASALRPPLLLGEEDPDRHWGSRPHPIPSNKSIALPSAAFQTPFLPSLTKRIHEAIRSRHYSPRTEKSYQFWVRRFVSFNGGRHPTNMGVVEVQRFLSGLATRDRISASTQNQAFCALLFLYREVLGLGLAGLEVCSWAPRTSRPMRHH
jgi:Phage integrase, N-terminal SAM-like domain